MKQVMWLVVAAVALAGCGEDAGDAVVDDCPEETHYLDAAGVCTAHTPASVVVSGLPGSVQQYGSAEFTWSLDNGTHQHLHSMDSRILVNSENTATTNMTGPDDWGTLVAKEQHQDLPGTFSAKFDATDATGTFYLRGYMQINGENVWTDLGTIDVTAVTASGNYTDVAIVMGDAGPAVEPASVTIKVGNGVSFTNSLPYAYTISFDGDDCPADGTIAAGDPSGAAGAATQMDFLVPGQCKYTLSSPIGGNDPVPDPGTLTGTVQVSAS